MNNNKVLFALKTLCSQYSELDSLFFEAISPKDRTEKYIQKEICNILQKLAKCLLNPEYTIKISYYMQSWLLEILNICKFNIVRCESKDSIIDLEAHSAFCVCISKLFNYDIAKFALNYFEVAPSPFYSLTEETHQVPLSKKPKLDYEIPSVGEAELLKSTYVILSQLGTDVSKQWEFSFLIRGRYLEHTDESVRWFACNMLSLVFKMNEDEKKSFILRHVSSSCHTQMVVSQSVTLKSISHERNQSKSTEKECSTLNYVCKIGRVIIPLHSKAEVKSKDSLVPVASTLSNLEAIALGISSSRPVLIESIVGGGKTSLVIHLAEVTGRVKAPELTKIQLSDQTDSKTLIGTYRCTANPGEFIWQAGSLTQAVMAGHWLLLEDIDFAPLDAISLLIPLLESRTLLVPGHGNIKAHPNFQVFATRRVLPAGSKMRIGSSRLLEKLWVKVSLTSLTDSELKQLICTKWPELKDISEKLVEVYLALSYGQHKVNKVLKGCEQCESVDLSPSKTSGRFVSVRDLMKWCSRMVLHIDKENLNVRAFQESLDCFCSAIPNGEVRYSVALHIGSHLNISQPLVDYYFVSYCPEISIKPSLFTVGMRGQCPRLRLHHVSLITDAKSTFSRTRLSSCLLEKVTVAVMNEEPVLIVGETGTGKTSNIQYLAQQTNHSLRVINMNQQSDSADLLGGFKPVEVRTIISPLRNEFEHLFANTFSAKQNNKFLNHIMMTFTNQKWDDLFTLINHSAIKGKEKLVNEKKLMKKNKSKGKKKITNVQQEATQTRTPKDIKNLIIRWNELHVMLKTVKDQIQRVKSSLAFSFIEGVLVKAVQKGEWVLLDEINLASADTLECLSGLLESSVGSLTLHERGDSKPVTRHSEFRLFACMNPATDIGKKELPAGLRNRFTEFFMEDPEEKDLRLIVQDYLQEFNPSPKQINGIVKFYLKIKKKAATELMDGTGQKPHFSLRTLCRALIVVRRNHFKNFKRTLYEAFCLSFLTQLDRDSYEKVIKWVESDIVGSKVSQTKQPSPNNPDDFVEVEGFWVPSGDVEPEFVEDYILTESVRRNLRDLVRIVSIGQFPILLQGDTSVGKTSLITYLAKRSGTNCVRINNHQHTDLQEYVGSYSPDESGKLVFKEGVLIKAMRNGHWLILDELNLAPTDVLEALNRLLDENRELFIPEIETTVKAHPKFVLFATQNPSGLYGGRQALSRAFRNRFVELHFDRIPNTELEMILHQRCKVSPSLAKRMVNVLKELQTRRRESNLFQGKQSFVTLRDLFRWAERYRQAPTINGFYDWDQHVADEGYLVLAGKIRFEEETRVIKEVIKKHLKRDVELENLFTLSEKTSSVTRAALQSLKVIEEFEHIVWTEDMRRLFVLVSKSLSFCEPILLVGETGCGKTTVCQLIAALNKQRLFTVNCHMHTEGADFLGGLRPVRDRLSEDDDRLFEWVDGPLIESMKDGGMFLADEISLADDSVLERLNSLLEPERTLTLSEKGSTAEDYAMGLEAIVAHDRFRLIGTMNPGGDYGKKELSPALRNRLTEIWCPKMDIKRSSSDIKLIINHNLHEGIHKKMGDIMLAFLKTLTDTELGKKLTMSIRDILSWVSFINKVTLNDTYPVDEGLAFVHGACIVLLDGLGSGISGNSVQDWKKFKDKSLKYLCLLVQRLTQKKIDMQTFTNVPSFIFCNDSRIFGIEPFIIKKGDYTAESPLFSFKAPRTCLNLLHLLRGLQLSRPILLEGSPGVGKTSLVTALAKASGHGIVRINLSEQTDVSDLFGADLPVEGSDGGKFSWRDGPLLQALKKGLWIVLDELNLASQSVLEGLNACFDHRGEIYVPELNKTFKLEHQSTKIFACQNPHYQGGARKGLPKSFLNRFTQVFIEPLTSDDLNFILGIVHPDIPSDLLSKMVDFNEMLVKNILEEKQWGTRGGPWELNLRDMFRWCEIMLRNQSINQLNPGEYVELIYADRMRLKQDKEAVLDTYECVFLLDQYPLYRKSGKFFINEKTVCFGQALLKRKAAGQGLEGKTNSELFILHNQTSYLEAVSKCIDMNWMTLLVGGSCEGKTSLIHLLADFTGEKLETLSVNSQMDVTELLGGFEQADFGRSLVELGEELRKIVWSIIRENLLNDKDLADVSLYLERWNQFLKVQEKEMGRTTSEEVDQFIKTCQSIVDMITLLKKKQTSNPNVECLKKMKKSCLILKEKVSKANTISGGGTFEWVDSPLVKAVRDGHWLLIDGVNLCSPSVLDRLNGLLEPGGVLTMSERGVIRGEVPTVKPHHNFRLFLTMDPQNGEISRAMRNRGVEICMIGMWENKMDLKALLLSQGLDDVGLQNFFLKVHSGVCQTLPGYERPSFSCVGQAALLTWKLLQLGKSVKEAVHLSLNLVYIRNSAKGKKNCEVEKVINSSQKQLDTICKISTQETGHLAVNNMFLRMQTLLSFSAVGFPTQLASLCEMIRKHNGDTSKNNETELSLPNRLPTSTSNLAIGVYLSFCSLSLEQWEMFQCLIDKNCFENNLKEMCLQISNAPSNCFQHLAITCKEGFSADPRFKITVSGDHSDDVTSLSNKAMLGLWHETIKGFNEKLPTKEVLSKKRKKNNKNKGNDQSVLELSHSIFDGFVGEKMVLHPSFQYIFPLLDNISRLTVSLSNDENLSLNDDEYFNFVEAREWVERFKNVCQKTVTRASFHLVLPELAFHWRKVQDLLLDRIPSDWYLSVVPKEMNAVVENLKESFRSHCSELHVVIPDLRNSLDCPLPFSDEDSFTAYDKLNILSRSLVPNLNHSNKNELEKAMLLASEKGYEVRSSLVNLAFDLIEKSVDNTEVMIHIQNLDNSVSCFLSSSDVGNKCASFYLQLWPLIDCFLLRQLHILGNEKDTSVTDIIDCKELMAKSSCVPLSFINDFQLSKCMAAVSLYIFGSTNCSVLHPNKWIKFDPLETKEKDTVNEMIHHWKEEENYVLSPMGCLLSYHLLTGFCRLDDASSYMSVGNHSGRENQLNQIQIVLQSNWNHISNASYSYSSRFKKMIQLFVSDFSFSLAEAFKIKGKCKTEDYVQILFNFNTVLYEFKDLLGTIGTSLLKTVIDVINCVVSSKEDISEVAKLGVVTGLFQAWLLSHTEPLDPAQQRNLLLSYCKDDLDQSSDFVLMYKWINLLKYCKTDKNTHPHETHYKMRVDDVKEELECLSQKVAYRPEPAQYSYISEDISHFVASIFLPSRIIDLMQMLSNNKSQSPLKQCEGILRSCDKFVVKMVTKYPLYRDLIAPFLHAVVTVCESIRTLMVIFKNKQISSLLPVVKSPDCNLSAFDKILSGLLYFPLLTNSLNPAKFLDYNRSNQNEISFLLKECSPESSDFILAQSLSLRASAYDLYNYVVTAKSFDKGSFGFLKSILEKVILWWQEQESEKKRKAEEKESLFKYKARTLAISETEEEEMEREFVELFPDFDEEFKDLDQADDETEDMETESVSGTLNEDNGLIRLSDEHFEELMEIHKMLLIQFTETPWKISEKTCPKIIETPVTLRVQQSQLLMKSVGPYATHWTDEATIGSFLISNHIATVSCAQSVRRTVINKPKNYYHDPAAAEALKIRPLLETLDHKADKLLEQWPTHPSLLMIKKVIYRVLGFSVTSSMIRLVVGLEMVLEKSQEWEKNAHRGVSLMDELTPITEQVIEWRKMELKAWHSCLEMVSYKVLSDANKYWLHLFQTLLSASGDEVGELTKALKQFMESSTIGDFKKRLEILNAMHCQLCLEHKYCEEDLRKKSFETLISLSWNFYKYFSQFLPHVEENIKRSRKPIEKEVKDYVKIAKWNDINFFSVRDSVIKSRRTLHRHMRKWETILKEPVAPLLTDNCSEISAINGEWDKKERKIYYPHCDLEIQYSEADPLSELADETSYLNRIEPLTKKCFKFIKSIFEEVPYHESSVAVEEMTEEVISSYQELTLASAKAENMEDKEDRMRQFKDIMNRKKKSLSILFRSLHHSGVTYTKGNSLWKEDDLDKCLTVPPLDIKVISKKLNLDESLKSLWESCDKYFYKSIGRFSLLTNSLTQAHKDLGPEDIKKLKGFVSHLLLLCRVLRDILPEMCESTSVLSCMFKEVSKAVDGFVPVSKDLTIWWDDIYSLILSLSLIIDEEVVLLETFKYKNPLVNLKPSSSISEFEIQNIISDVKKIQDDVKITVFNCNSIRNSLCCDTMITSSLENINTLKTVVSDVSELAERLSMTLKVFDVGLKGENPLTKSLAVWLADWKSSQNRYEQWNSNLEPKHPEIYNHSDKIEDIVHMILKGVEGLFKSHCKEKSEVDDDEEGTKYLISKSIVQSMLTDFQQLRVTSVKKAMLELLSDLNENSNLSLLPAIKSVIPLLAQYIVLCRSIVVYMVDNFQALCKLKSVLLGIFQQLATKGFCRPQELEEGDGEGATEFQDSGPGMADGDGSKDVSERFESEDQLESALQQGEKEPEGNKDLKEDDGIEMSQDFEGSLQDIQREEKEETKGDDSENEDEEDELDKQMGETGDGADKLDEKLWGDDEENDENEEKKNEDEENGLGDGETTESEIVAKDDNKNKEENKDKHPEKKELETMDEDRREPEEEFEEQTYEDNYADNLGGEDHPNEDKDDDEMELPEDMTLDNKDKKGEEDGEDAPDLDPEIEEKGLFPEEEREPKEKGEEGSENGDNEEENNKEAEDDLHNDEEGDKSKEDKKRTGEEEDNEEDETGGENEALPSKDTDTLEEAQAADMETTDASKDKTKDKPETAAGAQVEDEDFMQEEQGQVGEQTEDVSGVGQSDSKTKEESHRGDPSALDTADAGNEKIEEKNKQRKPGDVDQMKTLGDVEKEFHRGLMTKKTSGNKEKEEKENAMDVDQQKEKEENEPEGRESDMYEHIGMTEDHFDKQMVDAATQEEAKLRPAPLEEEEEEKPDKEDSGGVNDTLVEVDDDMKTEEQKEEKKKRQADTEGNEGPQVKKFRDANDTSTVDDPEIHTEGDVISEMIVQRPIVNTVETHYDVDDEILAAIFDEDVAGTREKIEEADDGDAVKGSNYWSDLEGRISPLALQLCEQLRLILEPTEASKLRGDFRTGKRLNMRKIIPYIASQFRKDKIWLRRNQPSKRSYQVLLAVDDSESMNEMNAGPLARESVALVAKALTLLEAGQVGVVSFGTSSKILHPFHIPFTDRAGGMVFSNLTFSQPKSDFAQMLEDATALLTGATGKRDASSEISQLLLIISDGQTHARSNAVKAAVRAAREANVFIVFFILDDKENTYSFYDNMIYEDGELKLMVDSFPFPFFIVVRDIDGLPDAVATALRQWFELVTSDTR